MKKKLSYPISAILIIIVCKVALLSVTSALAFQFQVIDHHTLVLKNILLTLTRQIVGLTTGIYVRIVGTGHYGDRLYVRIVGTGHYGDGFYWHIYVCIVGTGHYGDGFYWHICPYSGHWSLWGQALCPYSGHWSLWGRVLLANKCLYSGHWSLWGRVLLAYMSV